MTVARITPSDCLVLLIDHQVGTLELVQTASPAAILRSLLLLVRAARLLNLPLILTTDRAARADGGWPPALAGLVADSRVVRRTGAVNAWDDPGLVAAVRATGRRSLIMGGVTTEFGLLPAAIAAAGAGLTVHAALDVSGAVCALAEALAWRRMEAAGVVLTTTGTLIAELAADWSRPHGQQLLQLLLADVLHREAAITSRASIGARPATLARRPTPTLPRFV